MSSFTYNHSIDKDAYNKAKLVQEDSENNVRKIYEVLDSSLIKKVGDFTIL